MIALIAIGSYLLLALVTWILFLAIMQLKLRRSALPVMTTRMGQFVLGIGYLADFTFNVASSLPFLDLPHEWLFTDRIKRHVGAIGWRGDLARWFRDYWLDCIDPNHCE